MAAMDAMDHCHALHCEYLRLGVDRNGTPTLAGTGVAQSGRRDLSHLTAGQVLISLISYTLVYGALVGVMFYLMRKYAMAGPDAALHESVDVAPGYGSLQDE